MALTPFNDPFFGSLLSRNDPFLSSSLSPFSALTEFSSLLDHPPIQTFIRDAQAISRTAVDVRETPTDYKFVADLPGLKKDEVKVQIEDGNVLSISGERTKEERQESDTWHRMERSSGKFMRRFRLPQNADLSKVHASAKEGVLTVTVPKVPAKEPEKPPAIEVQVKDA